MMSLEKENHDRNLSHFSAKALSLNTTTTSIVRSLTWKRINKNQIWQSTSAERKLKFETQVDTAVTKAPYEAAENAKLKHGTCTRSHLKREKVFSNTCVAVTKRTSKVQTQKLTYEFIWAQFYLCIVKCCSCELIGRWNTSESPVTTDLKGEAHLKDGWPHAVQVRQPRKIWWPKTL